MEFHAYISGAETMDGVWSDEWFNAILTNKTGDGQYKLLVGKAQTEGGSYRFYEARYVRTIDNEKISLQDIVGGNQRKESRNLMEHEVMSAPIGTEAAGEQKQNIERARTKIIDAAPLMERLKAAIAFGNEKGLPTDELEQVLADIEGMEELPTVQPTQLTDDDIETIRVHLSAIKENLCNQDRWNEAKEYEALIDRLTAQPEQHIDADGTLWITVSDIEQVKRVIVDEEKSKFCRQFYMDAQPEQRTGKWLPWEYARPGYEYKFHKCSVCGVCDEYVDEVPRPNGTIARIERIRNFCPNCGAKMNQSNKPCDCYRNGRCTGTKEIDPCSCGGVKSKCDFYENVRREGKKG